MKTKHRQAARAKQERRYYEQEPHLDAFGLMFDQRTGRKRNWYQDEGDVKRWAETGMPIELQKMEGSNEHTEQ